MKVDLPQRFHKLADVEYNYNLILEEHKKSTSDLVVFPELFLSGYLCRDKYQKVAVSLESDHIEDLRTAARKESRALIFGMTEAHPEMKGLLHNSAVYIDPQGECFVYRKIHLVNFGPFEEKRYFTEGKEVKVMDLNGCKFGIIICYDVFFPELAKLYALQGADVIVHISASPSATKVFFQKVNIARAIENTTFHVYSNLIGTERNLVYWGGSHILGPRGENKITAKEFEEDRITFEIDLSELKAARENRPTLRDTRFELFDALRKMGDIEFSKVPDQ